MKHGNGMWYDAKTKVEREIEFSEDVEVGKEVVSENVSPWRKMRNQGVPSRLSAVAKLKGKKKSGAADGYSRVSSHRFNNGVNNGPIVDIAEVGAEGDMFNNEA